MLVKIAKLLGLRVFLSFHILIAIGFLDVLGLLLLDGLGQDDDTVGLLVEDVLNALLLLLGQLLFQKVVKLVAAVVV